jgi:subtilase family serine protease
MKSTLGLSTFLLISALCFAAQPDRIPGNINSGETVVLAGNVAAQAQPQYDRGLVQVSMPMPYIVMQMQPSSDQQKALNRLLTQQQNRSSANYHKWLTPEQYAERFGLSASDVAKITAWLKAQGFAIVQTARGRDWIAFSGNAGLVEQAFHTEIHYYEVDGETHYANATPLSIPQALAGIVVGFRDLHDFKLKPMGIHPLSAWDKFFGDIVQPFYNGGVDGNELAPGDIATIYDISPLYSGGINGSGQKMVIVGQTDIHMTDIQDFRSNFGLPANNPTVTLVPGSSDPGVTSDELEADLDLEWSGAVARNASILYVNSTNVFDSASYAIDQDLAAVISMSYGGCESENAAFIAGNETTMQKASSEGITFMASSGDSGAAACDSDQNPVASQGLAVNYPASSPEVTGVGGNEFNENGGNYWGNSNGTNGGSALSYIPEIAWNDTAENNALSASGGGASSCDSSPCTSGFPKPSWQTGVGVPSDGVRDVPDVAMDASPDHDGYLFCSVDNGANCANGNIVTGETVGGTSAAAPIFAAIVVLLNQQLGDKPPAGLGNINSDLYTLAQNTNNAIFHDITTGNNIVPCTAGTKDCPKTAPFQYGYNAGTGYDQVTGLGSVDANNLVTRFTTAPTTTALSASPNPNPNPTNPVTFTATVSGTNAPTGTVTFYADSGQIGTPQTLSSGVASLQYSGLPVGASTITATYGGDSKNAPSTSSPLIETITTTGDSTTTVVTSNLNPSTYGLSVQFSATVTTTSGNPPSATVTFQDGSTPIGFGTLSPINSSSGIATFSTSALTAGAHSITGLYSGDLNDNGTSTSPAIQQVVTKAATTTSASVSPSGANVKSSGPILMSAAITPSSGPTGTVNYIVDGTVVGSAKLGSTFSYNPSSLASGNHSVTASYSGDSNFNSSTSSAVNLSVEDFKLTANPTTVSISAPGQSGTTTLTITPLGGFNQQLNYTCSGLPTGASCGFTAGSANTATVTILTSNTTAKLQKHPAPRTGILFAMLLPGILILPGGISKRSRRLLGLVCLAMFIMFIPACGGSGGSSGSSGSTSSVVITASTLGTSNVLSHTVTITLTVQ